MSQNYPLQRDAQGSIRLNLQHYVLKEAFGYLIHPVILEATKQLKNVKVADLATGTGIWLLDIADHFSSTQNADLHGFDISDAQFSIQEHVPPNVHFSILDSSNEDIPKELIGQFDIVHLRLLLSVVPKADPSAFISHALKLLKPGGYLQWDEADPDRTPCFGPNGATAPYLEECVKTMQMKPLRDHSWIARLPETFKSFGMDDIHSDEKHIARLHRKIWAQAICAVVEEVSSTMPPELFTKIRPANLDVDKALQEIQGGAWLDSPFFIAVGRKGLSYAGNLH